MEATNDTGAFQNEGAGAQVTVGGLGAREKMSPLLCQLTVGQDHAGLYSCHKRYPSGEIQVVSQIQVFTRSI